jgi:AMIN domain-containing protein
MRCRLLVVCACLSIGGSALGQDQTVLNAGQPYQGVIPGTSNPPPRVRLARSVRRTVVTWPGFQVSDQGSRIFVQTSHPVAAQESRGPSRLVYRLPGCVISTRNNRNPLVTTHFNTPVSQAYLRRSGHDVELVIELRSSVTPRVSNGPGDGGMQFLYVEFPPGDYLPQGPPPVIDPRVRVRSSGSLSPSTGSSPEPSPPTRSMGPTP